MPADPIRNLPDEVWRQAAQLLIDGLPILGLVVLTVAGAMLVFQFAAMMAGGGE